jgi:hypothetical protein
MIEVQNNKRRPSAGLAPSGETMIDLHYAPTPNGSKISIMLVRARPQVQAGLAIGKFVKQPFDEEARRNMFGQAAKEMSS